MPIRICNVHTNLSQKETTLHGSVDFPVACYEDDMQIESVPVHWHDEYEYIVATKGKVTVCLDTDKIVLKEGNLLFINSGCLHSVKSVVDDISVLRSLVIMPKLIGGSSESYFWHQLILPFSGNEAPSYILLNEGEKWQKNIVDTMLLAWDAITNQIYDYENEARFLLSRAMRILVDHLPPISLIRNTNDSLLNRMKLLLSHIENHYMDDISNHDLMELVSCSESVLLRSFNKIVGTSPMQYLLNYRIQKAAEQLLSTEIKSCDIAISCGFHDFSYFTKIFKRNTGLTPIEYRKAYEQDRIGSGT